MKKRAALFFNLRRILLLHPTILFMKNILFSALSLIISISSFAQDGTLDNSFGVNGKVLTNVGESTHHDGKKIKVQADGKILVAGDCLTSISGSWDFFVTRFLTDGSPDLSFGDGGSAITVMTSDLDILSGLELQSDGKIVVAGTVDFFSSNAKAGLVRYNSDGSLDSSFANDGILIDTFPNNNTAIRALSIQSDGKILIAGTQTDINGSECILLRYNSDGTRDTTFGVNGVVLNSFLDTYNKGFYDIEIQDDDKIVVGGFIYTSAGSNYLLARYNTNGSIDSTFDGDGMRTQPLIGTLDETIIAIEIQNDGKIVASIEAIGNITLGNDIVLVRFNSDGSDDTSFDSDGLVVTDLGVDIQYGIGTDLLIQNDGKIIVVGYQRIEINHNNFILLRYHSNGSLDNSFDSDGMVLTDFDALETCDGNSVCLQSDGKILAAGTLIDKTNGGVPEWSKVAVARYNNLGSNIGFPEIAETSFTITPNPFSDNTIIHLPIDLSNGTILITSASGDIMNEIHNMNGNTFLLNRNQLSSGVYFVQISSDQFSGTEKIVIW